MKKQVTLKDKNKHTIAKLTLKEIKKWVENNPQLTIEQCIDEGIAIVNKAINKIKNGVTLKENQVLAIIMMLQYDSSKNISSICDGLIGEVPTGEGKTLIIASSTILRALMGQKVDIVTSSSVLAMRDCAFAKPFFQAFGISVDHNIQYNKYIGGTKACYENKQVIYGDL